MESITTDIKTEPASDDYGDFTGPMDVSAEIKTEPSDEAYVDISPETFMNPADVKIEPDSSDEIRIPPENLEQFAFKCRICAELFTSRYAFTLHVNKHEKKCVNCKVVYQTWKEVENHEPFCARRFGRKIIVPRVNSRREKVKKLTHKCSLCNRRYEKYQQLFNHQVHRCQKRYVTSKWVVKI